MTCIEPCSLAQGLANSLRWGPVHAYCDATPCTTFTHMYIQISTDISRLHLRFRSHMQARAGGEEARDRASGEVQEVRSAADGLLLASTYLDGTSGCWHHHYRHLTHLIRAGQLPRPCFGGVLTVLSGGLGWLLQLTQGRSLCIPASPRPTLAHPELYTAVWQGFLATCITPARLERAARRVC